MSKRTTNLTPARPPRGSLRKAKRAEMRKQKMANLAARDTAQAAAQSKAQSKAEIEAQEAPEKPKGRVLRHAVHSGIRLVSRKSINR